MVSGMVKNQAIALGSGGEGERNAGVAGGRLDQRGLAGRDLARRFQRLDHGYADAVLDAGDRVEEFKLGDKIGDDALFLGEFIEPHQRSVADRFSDRTVDAAAPGCARVEGGLVHRRCSTANCLKTVAKHRALWKKSERRAYRNPAIFRNTFSKYDNK